LKSFIKIYQFVTKSLSQHIEWVLLLLVSILLGIWAVKETIALRNTLLACGTLLSIYYIKQDLTDGRLKAVLNFWKLLPIGLIALVFVWVLAHYFLFSINQKVQIEELRSTWLRSLLATICGLGVGLILSKHPNRINILWLGIFISLMALLTQYIPQALMQKKLFVPNYDHYIIHLKFNTVLVGTIFLAGTSGALMDYLRTHYDRIRLSTLWYIFYWFAGVLITLWSFVFIVNARNGIGLSILLSIFLLTCTIRFLIKNKDKLGISVWAYISLQTTSMLIILLFTFAQMKVNSGWISLIDDAKIAVQIDRYQHWKYPSMGYPKNSAGDSVTGNNYERIAWAVAGLRAISLYPQGVGLLVFPYSWHDNDYKNPLDNGPTLPPISTHSGWIELGLAFGQPILALIFLAITFTLIAAARNPYPTKMTVLSLLVLIVFLYSTGEVAVNHGLEILFFFLALLPTLLLAPLKNSLEGHSTQNKV
jgi:hypothetical protein